jgi:hypothetical protein
MGAGARGFVVLQKKDDTELTFMPLIAPSEKERG